MSQLQFSKMHGLGNDFMIIDAVTQSVFISPETVNRLSDRQRGVGFDQLLIVEPPYDPDMDFHYRIYNADGSEVEQCGNGARCFARFVRMKGLTNKQYINVSTKGGNIQLKLEANNMVTVDMGVAKFEEYRLPFEPELASLISEGKLPGSRIYALDIDGHSIHFSTVSMGNPHAICFQDDLSSELDLAHIGKALNAHPCFPNGINFSLVKVTGPNEISVRVFERGAGETQACGTGACASAVVSQHQGRVSGKITVKLLGGELTIAVSQGNDARVQMTGPATQVFDGVITL